MKNFKYNWDSKTLRDFRWEDTLLERLRTTIDIERLVVKTDDEVVLFDGAPSDLSDELLLMKVVGDGESEFGEHFRTYSLYTVYVASEETPSYIELANCCIESHSRIVGETKSHESAEKKALDNNDIIRSLLRLAVRKSRSSGLNVYDLANDIAFVLGIELDMPKREEDDVVYGYDCTFGCNNGLLIGVSLEESDSHYND